MLHHFTPIKAFVFDVDGVLTDGTVLVLENGLQARRMHIKDGFALQMALKHGYKVKIISGGYSPQVADRLLKLGVTDVQMSVLDKAAFLQSWMQEQELKKEEVLFMGDDLPDLEALSLAGMPCCPADAVPEVQEACIYISPLNGGFACVRDVIEKVLRINGHWQMHNHIASR